MFVTATSVSKKYMADDNQKDKKGLELESVQQSPDARYARNTLQTGKPIFRTTRSIGCLAKRSRPDSPIAAWRP